MNSVTINDWKHLEEILNLYTKKTEQVILKRFSFRGQSNFEWQLTPSISRIVKGHQVSENKAKFYEVQATGEFASVCHLSKEALVYEPGMHEMARWIDMQHYGCPTRLLDWSSSPYVALYFAVSETLSCDGSLYVWDFTLYKHHCELRYGKYDVDIKEITGWSKYNIVQLALLTKQNERARLQQGSFSVSNNILKPHCEVIGEVLPEERHSSLTKMIIPKELKLEFLNKLRYMNITPSTLLPGLDSIGKEIREALLLRKWKDSLDD
jgi:FRG domain